MATGILSKPPTKTATPAKVVAKKATTKAPVDTSLGAAPNDSYAKLNTSQNKSIDQVTGQDSALASTAQGLLPAVQAAATKGVDFSALPQAPVQGDYNTWVANNVKTQSDAYDANMAPSIAQQNQDFQQSMADRGIAVGDPEYVKEQQAQLNSQNQAKQNALATATANAGTQASQLFSTGTQSQQNALQLAETEQQQPLTEYNQLMANPNNLATANLQYSNQSQITGQQTAAQVAAAQAAASGQVAAAGETAAGMTGVASINANAYANPNNYQNTGGTYGQYVNTNIAAAGSLANAGPSYAAQVGGQIVGTGAGVLGGYAIANA